MAEISVLYDKLCLYQLNRNYLCGVELLGSGADIVKEFTSGLGVI